MNQVMYFEVPYDDKGRAKQFYGQVFGWQVNDMPGMDDYAMVTTTPSDDNGNPIRPGAVNGGLFQRTNELQHPLITIHVDSLDVHLPKVEAAGGTVIKGKTEIPGMGFYAYVRDTESNLVGLWQDAEAI